MLALLNACAAATPTATPAPTPAPTATTVPSPVPTINALQGGMLATFEVNDQEFKVWVTNPQTIQQIIDVGDGKSDAKIPSGKILRGPGQADYNAPWTWHLDPQEIEMAEFTIEVCDAEPNYVEANVTEFVDVVGRYCPWTANLVSIEDYR